MIANILHEIALTAHKKGHKVIWFKSFEDLENHNFKEKQRIREQKLKRILNENYN